MSPVLTSMTIPPWSLCWRQPAATSERLTGRHEVRLAAVHRHAVHVTPILGSELADEGRLPEWPKAVPVVNRGETGEERADEERPPAIVEGGVVNVHVARGPGDMRLEHPIVMALALPVPEDLSSCHS